MTKKRGELLSKWETFCYEQKHSAGDKWHTMALELEEVWNEGFAHGLAAAVEFLEKQNTHEPEWWNLVQELKRD